MGVKMGIRRKLFLSFLVALAPLSVLVLVMSRAYLSDAAEKLDNTVDQTARVALREAASEQARREKQVRKAASQLARDISDSVGDESERHGLRAHVHSPLPPVPPVPAVPPVPPVRSIRKIIDIKDLKNVHDIKIDLKKNIEREVKQVVHDALSAVNIASDDKEDLEDRHDEALAEATGADAGGTAPVRGCGAQRGHRAGHRAAGHRQGAAGARPPCAQCAARRAAGESERGRTSETLFERELFGHERGAFTDAHEARPGRFAVADGGTLFLDEIGTLALAQQVRLLRVLQEGEFEPLGSTRTRKVDVRVVAATNVDLKAEVAAGRFREDLYYRLNVVEIRMPPLAERPGDVPLLAEFFRDKFARKNRKTIRGFTGDALAALTAYAWPGNVRELENLIERAVIVCKSEHICLRDLPLGVPAQTGPTLGSLSDYTLEELERAMVQRVLEQQGGNISRAASALGLSRAAIYRRMEKFGLS